MHARNFSMRSGKVGYQGGRPRAGPAEVSSDSSAHAKPMAYHELLDDELTTALTFQACEALIAMRRAPFEALRRR